MSIRSSAFALFVALGLVPATVSAQQVSDDVVRVGVLTDMTGPYADFAGPGSVVAARMAVEDHGGRALGRPVEVIFADHQNKPDVGGAMARRWIDTERVDMIIDMPNSAVALAVTAGMASGYARYRRCPAPAAGRRDRASCEEERPPVSCRRAGYAGGLEFFHYHIPGRAHS